MAAIQALSSQHPNLPPKHALRFGGFLGIKEPLDVFIAKNATWNRLVIELLGVDPWLIYFARNKYERFEQGWDVGTRLTLAIAIPLILGALTNKILLKNWQKELKLPTHIRPLNITYAQLQEAAKNPNKLISTFENAIKERTAVTPFSAKTRQAIQQQAKKLIRQIENWKIAFLAIDLGLMATKGQVGFWGKNWLTKWLTGKSSFSGIFDYASEKYQADKTKAHEEQKDRKMKLSIALGYGGALLLPLLVWFGAKNPFKQSDKLFKAIQGFSRHFDYTDSIHPTKWLVLWHMFFNRIIPGSLSARDKNEFREHLIKCASIILFFFIGDDIISGWVAKGLQKCSQKVRQALPKNLSLYQKGIPGFPRAIKFNKLYHAITHLKPAQQNKLMNIGRIIFWAGILGTSFFSSVTTIMNNKITKLTVQKEDGKNKPQSQKKPLPPHWKAPPVWTPHSQLSFANPPYSFRHA